MLHSIGPVTTCFWHIMACLMHRNCSQMGLTMVLACRMSFINTLRPRQDGRHFPDDIFKWIFLNGNVWIAIKISLKFVPKGSVNNIPPLVQIMAWRRPGDKPLFEPMMVNLLTHMCVTRPQWVKVSFTPDLLPRPILQQANPLFQYHSGQDIMTTKSWSMASWGITLSPLPDYCPPTKVSNASVMFLLVFVVSLSKLLSKHQGVGDLGHHDAHVKSLQSASLYISLDSCDYEWHDVERLPMCWSRETWTPFY